MLSVGQDQESGLEVIFNSEGDGRCELLNCNEICLRFLSSYPVVGKSRFKRQLSNIGGRDV